jgi:hypothetical protein
MNKEEQIKEMARALCGYSYNAETGYCNKSDEECDFMCPPYLKSKRIYSLGYGDTKQAVKEFAEKLKEKFIRLEKRYGDEADRDENAIPNLQFEFYKPALERDGAFANGQATMANKALYIVDELLKEVCGE